MVRCSAELFARLALLSPLVLGACGPSVKNTAAAKPVPPAPVVVVEAPPVPPPPVPLPDPVEELIARSNQHFKTGVLELEAGHTASAKEQFDKAIDVLIESPYGGRTEPRIRQHFDRLVDRISTYELKALAQGDGFTEKQYEPASIDQLLAASETLVPPSAELKTAVDADLQNILYDLPIPLNNQRVLSFIQLFQGRLHDFLLEGLQRGSQYLPMIQNVLRAEGLPLDLAYVPLVESAFKPNALSRAKAKGVWQFMQGTGLENGLRSDWYIDERSDPEKATIAAAKYLNTLAKMFDGDWHLALASYNGGPGRVQRAQARSKQKDFWSLAGKANLLPRETRDYVPMILAAVVIARNPLQYGFEVEPMPSTPFETVGLPGPVDLRKVAEWTDSEITEIQSLNPELRRWTTPIRDGAYQLKVPVGGAQIVQAKLAESDMSELASLNWYIVKKGENLATIARKLRVSRTDLAEANYLRPTATVAVGQRLIVPRETAVLLAARTEQAVPVADSRPLTKDTVIPAVNTAGAQVKITYEVQSGDTLSSIARVFSTTVASIQSWNRMPSTLIRTGDHLTIYTVRAN
jgi:membrane-bound lytic murein transglycosylase D